LSARRTRNASSSNRTRCSRTSNTTVCWSKTASRSRSQ
jgi:hypothetical protein